MWYKPGYVYHIKEEYFLKANDPRAVAFLLQNMSPITEEYIDHPHTRNGNPVPVHTAIQKILLKNMKEILEINRAGKPIVFPDIKRLEAQMLAEREASLSFKEVATGKEKKPDDY